MNRDPNVQLITVFRTEDPGLAALVVSILQGADIEHVVKGGTMKGGRLTEFLVREPDAKDAALLLAKLTAS